MKSLYTHKLEYGLSNTVKFLAEEFIIEKCKKNAKTSNKY